MSSILAAAALAATVVMSPIGLTPEELPESFPNARRVQVVIDPGYLLWLQNCCYRDGGQVIAAFRTDRRWVVLGLRSDDRSYAHELGHAIWFLDLDFAERARWKALHREWVRRPEKPYGIQHYRSDPSHSFAVVFSDYVTRPARLNREFPSIYEWFRTFVGREFHQFDTGRL